MRLTDRINPFKRKSAPQRLMETVEDAIAKPIGGKLKLPDMPAGKTARTGLLALAGAMGLTAGSAGVSSLRRRGAASKSGS